VKKGIFVLLIAVVLALVSAMGMCWFHQQRTSPEDWLRREFGLNQQQAQEAAALHREYEVTCVAMCARIVQADDRLAKMIHEGNAVTPEIRAAIAETDAIRTECRVRMLEYFYKIAETIPPEKKQKYLDMVLPPVLQPGDMTAMHGQ